MMRLMDTSDEKLFSKTPCDKCGKEFLWKNQVSVFISGNWNRDWERRLCIPCFILFGEWLGKPWSLFATDKKEKKMKPWRIEPSWIWDEIDMLRLEVKKLNQEINRLLSLKDDDNNLAHKDVDQHRKTPVAQPKLAEHQAPPRNPDF
jgi:hypothetical protein